MEITKRKIQSDGETLRHRTLALVIVAGLPVFIGVIILIKPRQRRAWQNQSNKNSNYNEIGRAHV